MLQWLDQYCKITGPDSVSEQPAPKAYAIVVSGISCTPDQFLANMVRLGFLPEQALMVLNRLPYRLMSGLNAGRAKRYNAALTDAGAITSLLPEP